MGKTLTIEIPAEREALIRRLLALGEELDHLAINAPHGTVFDACEAAVISGGRDVQRQLLSDAVSRCVEDAEKKGLRSAAVPVDTRKKAADRKAGNS